MNDDFKMLREVYTLCVESLDSIRKYLANRTQDPRIISFFTQRNSNNAPLFNDGEVIAYFKWLESKQANINIIQAYHKKYRSLQPPRRDIKRFKDFQSFEQYVDGIIGRAQIKQKKNELHQQAEQPPETEDVIVDNNEIQILHGSSQDKCVRYGKGYTFCVADPEPGQNMYSSYRYGDEGGEASLDKATSFYFIFFKKIPKSDIKHICVLNIRKDKSLAWTFADNDTKDTTWEEVLQTYPILSKYTNKFKFYPLSKEEKTDHILSAIEFGNDWDNGRNLKLFVKLEFNDKIKFISKLGVYGHLTDNEFNYILKDKTLTHALANTGLQMLSYRQYLTLPAQEQKWYTVKAKRLFDSTARAYGWNVTSDNLDSIFDDPEVNINYEGGFCFFVQKSNLRSLLLPNIFTIRYLQDPSSVLHKTAKKLLPKNLDNPASIGHRPAGRRYRDSLYLADIESLLI